MAMTHILRCSSFICLFINTYLFIYLCLSELLTKEGKGDDDDDDDDDNDDNDKGGETAR